MLKNEQNLETEELLKTLTDVFHTTPDYTERVLRQILELESLCNDIHVTNFFISNINISYRRRI